MLPRDQGNDSFLTRMITNGSVSGNASTNITSHLCPTAEVESTHIAIASYFIVAVIVGLTGNILVCHAILATRSLRTTSNILIVSLAISDVGVALTLMPYRIAELLNACMTRGTCMVFMMTDVIVSTSSVMTLLAIAVERALTLITLNVNPDDRNCRKAIFACAFIWMYSVVSAALGPFDWNQSLRTVSVEVFEGKCVNDNQEYIKTLFITNFFLPLFVISVIYSWLAMVLKRRSRAISRTTTVSDTSIAFSRRLQKATKTLVVIYSCFLFCWLPSGTLTLLQTIDATIMQRVHAYNESLFFAIYYIFVVILPPLNSTLNPFIYGFYHGGVRKAVVEAFIGKWTSISPTPMPKPNRNSQSSSGSEDDSAAQWTVPHYLETAM